MLLLHLSLLTPVDEHTFGGISCHTNGNRELIAGKKKCGGFDALASKPPFFFYLSRLSPDYDMGVPWINFYKLPTSHCVSYTTAVAMMTTTGRLGRDRTTSRLIGGSFSNSSGLTTSFKDAHLTPTHRGRGDETDTWREQRGATCWRWPSSCRAAGNTGGVCRLLVPFDHFSLDPLTRSKSLFNRQ